MKAIIYAGIGLFSVASVYGIVDYYGSQQNGSINKLYVEEEPKASQVTEEKATAIIPVKNTEALPAKTGTVAIKTKPAKKAARVNKIKMDDFSRARIPEQLIEEKTVPQPEEKTVEITSVARKEVMEEKVEITEVENKKISLDMYSRAPLKKKVKTVKQIAGKN